MKFEIRKAKGKQSYYFVLLAKNGEVVVTSETYKSKQSCKDGIKAVKYYTLFSKTIDLT